MQIASKPNPTRTMLAGSGAVVTAKLSTRSVARVSIVLPIAPTVLLSIRRKYTVALLLIEVTDDKFTAKSNDVFGGPVGCQSWLFRF